MCMQCCIQRASRIGWARGKAHLKTCSIMCLSCRTSAATRVSSKEGALSAARLWGAPTQPCCRGRLQAPLLADSLGAARFPAYKPHAQFQAQIQAKDTQGHMGEDVECTAGPWHTPVLEPQVALVAAQLPQRLADPTQLQRLQHPGQARYMPCCCCQHCWRSQALPDRKWPLSRAWRPRKFEPDAAQRQKTAPLLARLCMVLESSPRARR
jgi:hypothetical protein